MGLPAPLQTCPRGESMYASSRQPKQLAIVPGGLTGDELLNEPGPADIFFKFLDTNSKRRRC